MTTSDFTITLLFDCSPNKIFKAITDVRSWWSEQIDGNTNKLLEEFHYRYQDVHRCRIKIVELVPDQKVIWQVVENYFNFTKDKNEWTNTKISFEISDDAGRSKLVFTHIGLSTNYECYDICSDAWENYITNSLRDLIEKGVGQPNPYEQAVERAADLRMKNN